MATSGRSSLPQSWAYGDAKARHKGWRVERGVFYRDGAAIAVVQVLQKRIAGFITVSRINRGPLSVADVTPEEQRGIWNELARLGNVWKGRVLSVAPELTVSGPSLVLLSETGFRQTSRRAWESAWVDLRRDVDTLRAALDGKWRNMLTSSEKAELHVEIGGDAHLFDWMLDRYRDLMHARDFEGPPVNLLLALRDHCGEEDLLVFKAMHQERPVAGICVARHGKAATYLVGWNGDDGRGLRANHYLLWQAVIHLRSSGTEWFDVGGLDEEHGAGISSFKLGLSGERYELVGEFVKW